MEINQQMDLNLKNNNKQEPILKNSLWKTINSGIDIGLRYVFPNFMENDIINLKNNLMDYGLKDGIKKSINSIIEKGKNLFGIVSGNFQDIEQIKKAIIDGNIIDTISDLLDITIDKASKDKKVDLTISKAIKIGKNSILSNIEKNIKNDISEQVKLNNNLVKYINNWKNAFSSKDFKGMEKEYEKINKELKKLIPVENIIKEARYVENIHNLIKNNGNNFNLSEDEIELAKKLKNNINLY